MSEKHTHGPINLAPDKARYQIADEAMRARLKMLGISTEFDALSIGATASGSVAIIPLDESNEENARRLVACWNACEGADTEMLEKHGFLALRTRQVDFLENQRDELARALINMIDWLDDGNRMLSDACTADVEKARSIAAKVKGATP